MGKKPKTKCKVMSNNHTCLETQEVQKSMKTIKLLQLLQLCDSPLQGQPCIHVIYLFVIHVVKRSQYLPSVTTHSYKISFLVMRPFKMSS